MTDASFRLSIPSGILAFTLALTLSACGGAGGPDDVAVPPDDVDLLADSDDGFHDQDSTESEGLSECQTDLECTQQSGNACLLGRCDPDQHFCLFQLAPDGTACDTGNTCELDGICWIGKCHGAPLDCNDNNPCTEDSCDQITGCSHQFSTAACDDGNPCTSNDQCANGSCGSGTNTCTCDKDADCVLKLNGDLCRGRLVCDGQFCIVDPAALVHCQPPSGKKCIDAACAPATGLCVEHSVDDGTPCDDDDKCTLGESCRSGTCLGGIEMTCDDDNPCTNDSCDGAVGCIFTPNLQGCNDGNGCTTNDKCSQGKCRGDQTTDCGCRSAADCTRFEDGNKCNGTLVCLRGQCIVDSATIITCETPAGDVCKRSECIAATGRCQAVPLADGRLCEDGDPCTLLSICHSGVCTGSSFLSCNDDNACTTDFCTAGQGCDHTLLSGTNCNDGDACTRKDKCQAGVCTGTDSLVCTPLDQCHVAGECNSSTGVCTNPGLAENTGCDDNDACTLVDKCVAGFCTGTSPVVCTPLDQCHIAGECNTATGVCTNPGLAENTDCDDNDACTLVDKCLAGFCTGTTPVVCTPLDQCHIAGECNTATGVCTNPGLAENTGCDDNDACTLVDKCLAGFCTGTDPVVCTPLDQCHIAGECNTTTGICTDPNAPDNIVCDDNDPCTLTDSCLEGVCTGFDWTCRTLPSA